MKRLPYFATLTGRRRRWRRWRRLKEAPGGVAHRCRICCATAVQFLPQPLSGSSFAAARLPGRPPCFLDGEGKGRCPIALPMAMRAFSLSGAEEAQGRERPNIVAGVFEARTPTATSRERRDIRQGGPRRGAHPAGGALDRQRRGDRRHEERRRPGGVSERRSTFEDTDSKKDALPDRGGARADLKQGKCYPGRRPIARALIGRSEGDTVVVHTPGGQKE